MVEQVSRHQFLTALHELLRPKVYLEIGVQYGASLDLAVYSDQAWGIDPNPLTQAKGNQIIIPYRSDMALPAFSAPAVGHPDIPRLVEVDLAFIDGSHLFEDALQDFINIEHLCHRKSVIVFDDVLPYNQEIAAREMPPGGDWTGDVWKVPEVLATFLADHYDMAWVDTFPTGTFVVWDFPGAINNSIIDLKAHFMEIVEVWRPRTEVPDHVLDRRMAYQAQDIVDILGEELLT